MDNKNITDKPMCSIANINYSYGDNITHCDFGIKTPRVVKALDKIRIKKEYIERKN